jgi:hypothetical protein
MTTFTPTRHTSMQRSDEHHCANGFCTVCGSNWPCWRVQADNNLDVAAPTTAGCWRSHLVDRERDLRHETQTRAGHRPPGRAAHVETTIIATVAGLVTILEAPQTARCVLELCP